MQNVRKFLILSGTILVTTSTAIAQQQQPAQPPQRENIDMTKTDRVVVTPRESVQQTPKGDYIYPRGTEPRSPKK